MGEGSGELPWRNHAFGTYYALPRYSLVIKPLCRVIGEVFKADAYLAGSLSWLEGLVSWSRGLGLWSGGEAGGERTGPD